MLTQGTPAPGHSAVGVQSVRHFCIFAVKMMDKTFRVFTARISVFVFQLTTNLNCTVSFLPVLLDCLRW